MPLRLVLLGPPGVGKGTVGRMLCERFHLPYVSTGDMLRGAVASGSQLGKKVEKVLAAGQLVSDGLVTELVEERLSEPDCEGGFVLDGYPRTVSQAKSLDGFLSGTSGLDAVFNLVLAFDEIVGRLSSRRVCPACKRVYNLDYRPPAREGLCDYCNANLVQRADDMPETIKKRLQVYEEQTKPLIEYYKSKKLLQTVSGKSSEEKFYQAQKFIAGSGMG